MPVQTYDVSPKTEEALEKRFTLEGPKDPTKLDEMVEIFISSKGGHEVKTKKGPDGKARKYKYGSISPGGAAPIEYEVRCDAPVKVPYFIAETLRSYIDR